MGAASLLAEADLHGLVDGRLDPSRRAEVLRILAATPHERTRVEAWQEQADLIRSAFSGVDREPLPVSMRLVSPPPLHCVPLPVTTLRPPIPAPPAYDRRGLIGLVSVLLFVAAIGLAWMLLQPAGDEDRVAATPLRGSIDESLAALTSGAVSGDAARPAKTGATPSAWSGRPLPTTSIPDLTADGFMFTSAESRSVEPAALVFRYRDAAGARLVVSVARAPQDASDTAPTRLGRAYGWHQGANAYAIAGTVGSQRLRALAVSLKAAGGEE